ncbi:MAG: CDP-diacylglycerol--glycerol-3-phosphate 3-phosphatidyltransferase [Clostridiales bacterium]|nr:CDP-diacylglycerol--glycerol-3-phosphate 3-phosphatidyltransferase [Clostridiales bacterium]
MNLANSLTMLRILLVPVFITFVFMDKPYGSLIAAAVFLCAAATDSLDGYVARKRQEITNMGKLLDPLADKLLVTAALVCLVQIGLIPAWIAVVIIGREFLVTGLRGIAAAEGLVIAASGLAKWKTVFQISALSVLLLDDYFIRFVGFSPGDWLLYLALGFTVYTGYEYMAQTFSSIKMT